MRQTIFLQQATADLQLQKIPTSYHPQVVLIRYISWDLIGRRLSNRAPEALFTDIV